MAVKDESLHHATESLILSTPRKYYRAHIHTSHWQLRSLISSPTNNNVYFPSGNDIIRLNTQTKEREVITTLSFSPRCLTAAKGWICCGGDKGEYTAIPIDEEGDRNGREGSFLREFNEGLSSDPDARLPLDLETPRRSTPLSRHTVIMRRLRGFNHPSASPIKTIGTEIVNCVTLWLPPSKTSDETYQVPVAVVANNDCSVCIMDLQDSEVLEKLSFPDFVNRAVMSPDGKLLVAICDDPFMYVHRRRPKSDSPKASNFEDGKAVEYEWSLWGKVQLDGQRQADKSNMRGSFAAAFSKSGAYLAVATQYGVISVFDTDLLLQEDSNPLMTLFTSSRPTDSTTGTNAPGAVRAMEFSPEPFDLLAWTEASGRVGVADVRNLFYSRQSIKLDAHGDGVERVIVTDRAIERLEPLIDPRLRSFRAETPTSSTPDYLGLDFERRQLRNLSREMLDRNQSPLTPEEMQVLEAHQIARRERDAERDALAGTTPTPEVATTRTPHPWAAWTDDVTPGSASSGLPNTGRSSATERSTVGLPDSVRDFVNTDRSAASFRAFINERNQDRERRGQAQQPRRRGSIILEAAQNELERLTSARNELLARAPRTTGYSSRIGAGERSITESARLRVGLQSNDTEPSSSLERLRLDQTSTVTDMTQNIENLIYSSGSQPSADPPVDTTTRLRVEAEDDVQQAFARRLRQPWRPLDEFTAANSITRLNNRYEGSSYLLRASLRAGNVVDTMGCSWSEDGRILYVGAEDGIHEFHVNVQGRKMFPSLVLR